MTKTTKTTIIIVAILLVGGLFIYSKNKSIEQTYQVTTTSGDINKGNVVKDWKTYTNEKYSTFQYPQNWGDVLEHDEGENVHVIRIATDNNKTSDCIPFYGPNCKTNPDTQIFFQKGTGLFEKFVEESTKEANSQENIQVDGYPATSYTYVSQINDPSNPTAPGVGYFKLVLVGLQKSDKEFIEIAFLSPTFNTKNEAESYSVADFETFFSTVRFTK